MGMVVYSSLRRPGVDGRNSYGRSSSEDNCHWISHILYISPFQCEGNKNAMEDKSRYNINYYYLTKCNYPHSDIAHRLLKKRIRLTSHILKHEPVMNDRP